MVCSLPGLGRATKFHCQEVAFTIRLRPYQPYQTCEIFWYSFGTDIWCHLVSSALLLCCFRSKSIGSSWQESHAVATTWVQRATTSGATFDSLHCLSCYICITEPLEVVLVFSCFARYPSVRPILKKFGHQIHALRFQSRCY